MSETWRGKVVLVTGGSSGLGLAIARAFAVAGAKLVIAARGAEKLEQAAASLRQSGADVLAAMNALVLDKMTLFITDTYVNDNPSAQELAAITKLAAQEMRHFGLEPKAALVSHSIFGSSQRPSAQRMRDARALLAQSAPELPVLGEVHGDAALSEDIRSIYQGKNGMRDDFAGSANLLVMPSLDAANILFNVLKVTSGKGVTVGPILLGAAKSVHILSPSATVRRIVNMTALAVAEA